MNDENYRHFLFSLTIEFSLGITILAFFCGDDIMKTLGLKFTVIIALCIQLIIFLTCLGFIFFSNKDSRELKNWTVYSDISSISKNTEKVLVTTSVEENAASPNGQKLRIVEFDTIELKLPKDFFSKCKNIEKVTFYQKPKDFEKNTFSSNIKLQKVNLVGEPDDWKNFEIVVPASCEINFIPTKTVEIPEIR